MLAYEHIDNGHTGKWLKKRLRDFMHFADTVDTFSDDFNTKIEELKGILLNECNFDVAAEFAACNEERRGEYDKMRVVQ